MHTHTHKALCYSNVRSASLKKKKGNAKEQERLYPPEASTSNSLTPFVKGRGRDLGTGQICPVATLACTTHPSGIFVCTCMRVWESGKETI